MGANVTKSLEGGGGGSTPEDSVQAIHGAHLLVTQEHLHRRGATRFRWAAPAFSRPAARQRYQHSILHETQQIFSNSVGVGGSREDDHPALQRPREDDGLSRRPVSGSDRSDRTVRRDRIRQRRSRGSVRPLPAESAVGDERDSWQKSG